MNNIFVVGSEVKGESQIGYERYLDKFTDILLNTINNISITGLKRFGKTSLAKEVLERVKAKSNGKVITVFIDLAKQRSFSDMLVSIWNNLQEELIENDDIFQNRIFQRYLEKLEQVDHESRTYKDTFENVFKWLAKQNRHIILTIDEFDAASDLFKETADFEFLRDLSSNRDIGVSLVLVSRRQLYMIEKKNFNNSTFHGVVQTYPIDGFNEDDFNLFYKILKDKYNIELDEYSVARLKYFCGRSPYLVSMFAYDIVDDFCKDESYNIDAIYRKREIDIENYYKSIFACLNNDKISVDGAYQEVCTIEKLVGVIIGPKIDIVEGDIPLLEDMGYLYSEGDAYCSISSHFTNALHHVQLSVDTWRAVLTLEKNIKSMIRNQIMIRRNVEYIDYDMWVEIFTKAGANFKTFETYDNFIHSSMQKYKPEDVDILDVCNLHIAINIVHVFWDDWFSKFFDNIEWNALEGKLRLCANARNPMAHGHEEFLSKEDKINVNQHCKSILELLSKNNACPVINARLKLEKNIKKLSVKRKYYELDYDNASRKLIGQKGKMTAAEQYYKGIRGYLILNGRYYNCNVENEKWVARFANMPLSGHLGNEYEVKITDLNKIENSFQVELV